MRLVLTRSMFSASTTLGILTVVYAGEDEERQFGFTCEDRDRGDAPKVPGSTAIPVGTYTVRRTWSPRYGRQMPEVLEVPGFRGIRIHSGNDAGDTEGCILPGLDLDLVGWRVLRSRRAVAWLEAQIALCEEHGEPVTLEIRRDPQAWAAFLEV